MRRSHGANGVGNWNAKTAIQWMKGVARSRPEDVVVTDHGGERGTVRAISPAEAIEVIRTGRFISFEGPYPHNGKDAVKVRFSKQGRARAVEVVAGAVEGDHRLYVVTCFGRH